MVIAGSCSLTAVADVLAPLLGQSYNTLRERLRDTYREADAKAGEQRTELDVAECWVPWLAWLLDGWSGQQIAIALDATSLGDRFVVLAISVVYRGCAVPIAWKVLKAEEKHAWKPEWQALLKRFQGLVPKDWTVIVLADRGLYAKWLFEAIVELKWHPFLRVNTGGLFRPDNGYHWQPLAGAGNRIQGQEKPIALHAAELLGRRSSRSLAGFDRSGTGMRRCLLVRFESLDRTELQTQQTEWLAVATHAYG